MTTAMNAYIDHLISTKTEVSIGIRATGTPIGPGLLEAVPGHPDLVLMNVKVQIGDPQKPQRAELALMPVTVAKDEIAIVMGNPTKLGGVSSVGPNGKSAGGLIIPGA